MVIALLAGRAQAIMLALKSTDALAVLAAILALGGVSGLIRDQDRRRTPRPAGPTPRTVTGT